MGKPVRVMQLISSLQVGGAEKLLIELLQAARQDEDPVHFIVVVMNNAVHPGLREQLQATGFPVYFLNRPEGHRHPRYLMELLQLVRRHDIRIIHAHNGGSKLWAILCKLLSPGLQVVYTVHDTHLVTRLSDRQRRLHKAMIHMNIAISDAVAQECRDCGFTRVQTIYNGIPVDRFRPEAWSDHGEGPFRILNVARMDHRKKGQDILLRALKLCRHAGLDFHCRFIGGVYDYNRASFEYLQNLTLKLGLEDAVEWITECPDVVARIPHADLFVLPSRYEGLGLVVLEAMAAGVPVIASDLDGPAELIESGRNGLLFEPDNEADLAGKIMALARDPERRRHLREQALQDVRAFDIRLMKDRYLAIYGWHRPFAEPDETAEPRRVVDGVPV